jgi:PAS domain S-box-containing protein
MFFATQPILTSLAQGPPRGFLFMGRYLDSTLVAELAEITQLPLEISLYSSDSAPGLITSTHSTVELASRTVTGYTLLEDTSGAPYLIASAETPRTLLSQEIWAIGWLHLGETLIVLLLSVVALQIMKRWIASRFLSLENGVIRIADSQDFTKRLPPMGKDVELIRLTSAINIMLEKLSQSQALLIESESRYSTIVENVSDAIVIIEDGVYKYFNKRLTEMQGLRLDEEQGKSFADWVAPEKRAATMAAYNARMAGREAPGWYKSEIVHKDGHLIPVEVSARAVNINGRKNDIVVLHDTTQRDKMEQELRESEARYRMLAENSADMIWLMDLDGLKITYVSPSVQRLFGYPQEEFCELSLEQMLTPSSYRRVMETLPGSVEEFIKSGMLAQTPPGTFEEYHKNGTVIPVEVVVSMLTDKEGRVTQLLGITRDISERKKAEEEFRKYELISNNSRDIILFLNLDGSIIEANSAAVNTYGYTKEELLSKTVYDLRTAKVSQDVVRQITAANEHGILFETVHRRRDGSIFPVEVSSIGADIGSSRKLVSIVRDISERKKAEEELRKYELISNNSRDMVFFVNLDGSIIEANAAAVKAYGYTREELLSMTIYELRAENTHEDVRAHVLKMINESNEHGALFEAVHRRRDGSIFPVEISANGADIGPSRKLVSIVRDITERKKAEEQLVFHSNLLHNMHDGVIGLDMMGRITYWNEGATHLSGYTSEEMLGKTPVVLPPEMTPDEIARILSGISDSSDYNGEWRTITKKGDVAWVNVTVGVMRDGHGVKTGYIAVAKDITARKKIEEELHSKTAFLEAQLNTSIDGVLVLDGDGKVILENPRSRQLWGIPCDELNFDTHEARI